MRDEILLYVICEGSYQSRPTASLMQNAVGRCVKVATHYLTSVSERNALWNKIRHVFSVGSIRFLYRFVENKGGHHSLITVNENEKPPQLLIGR